MTTHTDKELFAACAASAPRLDLAFYVTYAQAHRDDYSETTRQIVREMIGYLDELTDRPSGSTAMQKRTVWTLIDRFKISIPQWYGNTGSLTVNYRANEMATDIARWVTHGRTGAMLDPKTPVIESTGERREEVAPVKPKAPSWRERALAAETQIRELEAKLRRQADTRHSADPRVNAINTASRLHQQRMKAAPVVNGVQACRQCQTSQALDQFTYGDGGRTVRSLCKTCHRIQQRDAAARRRAA